MPLSFSITRIFKQSPDLGFPGFNAVGKFELYTRPVEVLLIIAGIEIDIAGDIVREERSPSSNVINRILSNRYARSLLLRKARAYAM